VEAAFSDDGFALGLAYILKLLDQDADFDALHWFDSVRQHIARKKKEIENVKSEKKKIKGAAAAEEDLQHFQITAKRLAAIQLEFELLFYSFTGARIFFRDVHAEKKEDKKAEEETGAPPTTTAPGSDAPAPPSSDAPPMMDGFDGAPPPPPPPM